MRMAMGEVEGEKEGYRGEGRMLRKWGGGEG